MGSNTYDVEVLLLVLPTTEYQKRVPVAIGTTITDMVVDFIGHNSPEFLSKSWKVLYCATQSRHLVHAQPFQKCFIETTKPVTLPPFSTTTMKGSTKPRSYDMRLNLIVETLESTQLPSSVQCTPTYCILQPGSNRVAVGLKNISAKSITIPSRVVVGQLQQAKLVPIDQASKKQDKLGPNRGKEGTWF